MEMRRITWDDSLKGVTVTEETLHWNHTEQRLIGSPNAVRKWLDYSSDEGVWLHGKSWGWTSMKHKCPGMQPAKWLEIFFVKPADKCHKQDMKLSWAHLLLKKTEASKYLPYSSYSGWMCCLVSQMGIFPNLQWRGGDYGGRSCDTLQANGDIVGKGKTIRLWYLYKEEVRKRITGGCVSTNQ